MNYVFGGRDPELCFAFGGRGPKKWLRFTRARRAVLATFCRHREPGPEGGLFWGGGPQNSPPRFGPVQGSFLRSCPFPPPPSPAALLGRRGPHRVCSTFLGCRQRPPATPRHRPPPVPVGNPRAPASTWPSSPWARIRTPGRATPRPSRGRRPSFVDRRRRSRIRDVVRPGGPRRPGPRPLHGTTARPDNRVQRPDTAPRRPTPGRRGASWTLGYRPKKVTPTEDRPSGPREILRRVFMLTVEPAAPSSSFQFISAHVHSP